MQQMIDYLMARMNIKSDEGATAVEYGLLVALIAAVIVGIVLVLGGQVGQAFSDVSTEISKA